MIRIASRLRWHSRNRWHSQDPVAASAERRIFGFRCAGANLAQRAADQRSGIGWYS
ncbi:hypothetical protein GLA29479_2417 [Lysobacter antibioticus]|nr:hypothetical protein GLA29479_2417 [Lysobacter antibioticus]